MKRSLTKIFLSLAGIFAAGSLFAGPMPMDKSVVPVQPECNWTGFYVGVNAGITEFKSSSTDLGDWESYATMSYESPAFIGGGQVGYNYQWRDLVLGIEADFSGSNAKNHVRTYGYEEPSEGGEDEGYDDHTKVDFMATLRARLGISFNNNRALLYVTGGGAWAHGKWDRYYHYYRSSYGTFYEADWRGDDDRMGWVGGFGFEYALDCHWSLRAEGLYTWLNHDTDNIINGPAGSTYIGYKSPVRFEDELWTYRVGINYKFTGFGGGH
jgi:outer membrane immunogenic protein